MTEIWNLNTLCRCCHAHGEFKSLQTQYNYRNELEVYSVYLRDTFGIWINPPTFEASYSICEECIVRLRDANRFKNQVLQCEQKFQEYCQNQAFLTEQSIDIKNENDSDIDLGCDTNTEVENNEIVECKKEIEIKHVKPNDNVKDEDTNKEVENNEIAECKKEIEVKLVKLNDNVKDEDAKMPRKRERTTTKGSWTVETLENAVKNLRRGSTSVYKVSKETGIPYSTLKKRFKLAKSNNASYKCPPKLGRPSVFTEEQEAILADHAHKMSNKFYGLTRAQFCKICYAMAEQFGVADRFNETKKSAGRDFLNGFFQRHPELSVRKPEATSINRILGFNKVEVDRFFENLENVMTKHNFPPSRIYNIDETGVTTVQETEKIIAPRGQKRVGAVTSWERGKNVTAICAMSAAGSFIPPLFIFPRQRHSPQLEKDGPPGAVYTCSHNGWTNEGIYIKWLRHFIEHSKPNAEQPVLLIMDNHNSHCTLEAWEVAKANNVVVLSIPPHSSHRLQPLDVTFFGPLKRAYNKECDMFIKSRNMVKVTPYEIAGLFNKAYARVASLDKGISGFKSTGIFPMNPAVFSEDDFAAVDKDQNQANEQPSSSAVAQCQIPVSQQLSTGNSGPLPSTSLTVNSATTFPSTANISQEQLPDIDHVKSPSILNDFQEEASTSNSPKLSPKINPATIPLMLNDKTRLEPATANRTTTSCTTNDKHNKKFLKYP